MIKSPGLNHILETILEHLDNEDIVKFGKVNKESGEIVEGIAKRPWFWFKKCRKNGGIPQQHHENSTEVMKILGKPNQPQNLTKNVDQVHSAINEMLELANKVELNTEILNMLSALYGNILAPYLACFNSDQIDQQAYDMLFHNIVAHINKEGNQSLLHKSIIDDAIAKAFAYGHSHIVNYLKFGKF